MPNATGSRALKPKKKVATFVEYMDTSGNPVSITIRNIHSNRIGITLRRSRSAIMTTIRRLLTVVQAREVSRDIEVEPKEEATIPVLNLHLHRQNPDPSRRDIQGRLMIWAWRMHTWTLRSSA